MLTIANNTEPNRNPSWTPIQEDNRHLRAHREQSALPQPDGAARWRGRIASSQRDTI